MVAAHLRSYSPFELIGFGIAYSALFFILLPRVAYFVSSLVFLLILVEALHMAQQNMSSMALSQQFLCLLLISCMIFTQLYCVAKTFSFL